MQVPVKVTVDSDTKEFSISIGTPPASALIKKEAKIQKAASNPKTDKVADLKIEQIIKIAKMKEDALLGKSLKHKVREIVGTCQSMGILVEGIEAQETLKAIKEGKFDAEIKAEKTELTSEELKELEEERKRLEAELKERRAEFETQAKVILESMKGKARNVIKTKMVEAGIPSPIIEEMLPEEEKKEPKK
jgi:ABC-type phosphate transport system auxiliary subunit